MPCVDNMSIQKLSVSLSLVSSIEPKACTSEHTYAKT